MRAKTKSILLLAIVLGMEAAYVGGQANRIIEADKQHTLLTKKNQELHTAIARLQAKVQAEQASQQTARIDTNQPMDSGIYIPVPVDALKNSPFSFTDIKFTLSKETVNVLSLSDDEAGQVQKTLLEFQGKIHAYQKAMVQTTTVDKIPNAQKLVTRMAKFRDLKVLRNPPHERKRHRRHAELAIEPTGKLHRESSRGYPHGEGGGAR